LDSFSDFSETGDAAGFVLPATGFVFSTAVLRNSLSVIQLARFQLASFGISAFSRLAPFSRWARIFHLP
jgi:hypothetical protein